MIDACEILKKTCNYFKIEIEKLFEKLEDKHTKGELNNSQIDIHHNIGTKQQIHTPLSIENDISKNQKFSLNSLMTTNDNRPKYTFAEKIIQRKSIRIMKSQNRSHNRDYSHISQYTKEENKNVLAN